MSYLKISRGELDATIERQRKETLLLKSLSEITTTENKEGGGKVAVMDLAALQLPVDLPGRLVPHAWAHE